MSDQYEKYKVSKEDVEKWTKDHYPQFLGNETVMLQLYLRSKGVKLNAAEFALARGEERTVAELEVDEWSIVNVVAGIQISDRPYSGCPDCRSKVDDSYCDKCKKTVEPDTMRWVDYSIGDATGDIQASFPPGITDGMDDLEGKVLRLVGVKKKDGNFLVNKLQIVTATGEAPKAKAGAKDVQRLLEIIETWPETPYQEVRAWHREQGIQVPIDELIEAAGLEIVSGNVQKKSAKPAAKEAKPKAAESDLDKEVNKLLAVFEVASEVKIADIKKWHSNLKIQTPLDKLIEAAGCESDGKLVKRK